MNNAFYILKGKEVVLVKDATEWGEWFEKAQRHVKQEMIGDVRVSTVFLGLDHQYGDGPPLVFETMIFGGEHDQETWRYTTWKEAERGHERAVKLVKETK